MPEPVLTSLAIAGSLSYFRDEKPTPTDCAPVPPSDGEDEAKTPLVEDSSEIIETSRAGQWSMSGLANRFTTTLGGSKKSEDEPSSGSNSPETARRNTNERSDTGTPPLALEDAGEEKDDPMSAQKAEMLRTYHLLSNYFIKPEKVNDKSSPDETPPKTRRRASTAEGFSPTLFLQKSMKSLEEASNRSMKSLEEASKVNLSQHFQVLGMKISLEQIDSEEESDDEGPSMEMNSFGKQETSIDKYRRAIKEYYAKELENNMIEWKRIHKQGTYIEYLKHAVPENIRFSEDGEVEWIDPRTERVKRTFDRVEPSHALHVLGDPPQPEEIEDFLEDLKLSPTSKPPPGTQLRRAQTVPLPQKQFQDEKVTTCNEKNEDDLGDLF
jgi:hypothetical protein